MATLAPAQPIKVAILTLLNQLVTAGTLGTAISYDLSKNPLSDAKLSNVYPVALLGTAKVEGKYVLVNSNERVYTFPVMVISKLDNVADGETGIETLVDAVLNLFDSNPTLDGACQMLEAAGTPMASISTPDKRYSLFLIELKAHVVIDLTFSF